VRDFVYKKASHYFVRCAGGRLRHRADRASVSSHHPCGMKMTIVTTAALRLAKFIGTLSETFDKLQSVF